MHEPPPPPPPSPYPEELAEEPLWHVNIGNLDAHEEREVALTLNVKIEDTLILAGHAFVEHGADFGGYKAVSANAATAYKVSTHDMNPRLYKEAMASENASEWYKAMCDEMNSLKDSGTWRPVYVRNDH